ncbi:exonuclease domain-containing protein [Mangrovimonas aestuarii]|uniref:exonuclease domain-containing protein n=1 Tax=Mangrovimonas aestuarii TaxID=3018443 RepID=UPI00237858FC|nr:exonuclease domain-containing protein [Mangrovimonas aestuarii]
MIYSIVDIETTGSSNKITEIAIFKYDGDTVIDEFTSLVNPQTYIPPYITALTGIDNTMVDNAPTFAEVAEQIAEITKDTVFVAHNVNFDYNIIRSEFKEIEMDFRRPKLCTVRLSRKLLPGFHSYSLGKLCSALNIDISGRHRARGDAEATVTLLKQLLNQDQAQTVVSSFLKRNSKEATLPPHLDRKVFEELPETTGIYFFKDKKGKIIYVGKAKSIKKRVLSHFYDKSEKERLLCSETVNIDHECSGSELVALLMEDAAIKQHFPKYNQAAKRPTRSYALFSYKDRRGINHLAYNPLKNAPSPLLVVHSIRECRDFLEKLCKQFNLCPKYCHLQESVTECSHYNITNCKGVCRDKESVALYNVRVQQAINHIKELGQDNIIKEIGRTIDEEAYIWIKNGVYQGYGFIDKEEQINTHDDLEPYLVAQKDNTDIQRILRSALLNQ